MCKYNKTDLIVVNDADNIIAGGQGAPLAPLFHDRFFGETKKIRAVINIGGIANISIFGKELDWICYRPRQCVDGLMVQRRSNPVTLMKMEDGQKKENL